jgi:hypothetical protein
MKLARWTEFIVSCGGDASQSFLSEWRLNSDSTARMLEVEQYQYHEKLGQGAQDSL